MNIEWRNRIRRISVLYNVAQYTLLFDSWCFYKIYNIKTNNVSRIKGLKNSHKGERCFIVGNGPSLTMEDLDRITQEDCFAANLIYRIFDKTKWRPKYYFVFDRYADTGNVLDTIDLPYLFISDYYWKHRGINNKNAICLHSRRSIGGEDIKFSEKIEKVIFCNWTVTHAMIQMAVYMGYNEIYLLGMDHSYTLTYDNKGNVIEDKKVISHVFKDTNSKEVIANIEGMNKAYIVSKNYADSQGIKIYNATRGGKLEWFPRKDLEDVLK